MSAAKDALLIKKTLTYANGYRELGMFKDAIKEIDSLPEKLLFCEPAVQMRVAVFMEAKQWKKALPFVEQLAKNAPDEVGNIVNLAFVMRRAHSLGRAIPILLKAAQDFPDAAIVHYNLGCYACCDKQLDDAKAHLIRAFAIDKSFLDTATEDEDLAALHAWVPSLKK